MLKRIAVVGDTRKLAEALSENRGEDIDIVAVRPSDPLPPGTCAVGIFGKDCPPGTADLLLRVAGHYEEILELLALAIDAREQLPEGSAKRARDHATRFAIACGLSADQRLALERGALIHGIGKLRIPNDVLLKKAVLTYDEWLLLQSHTTLGADLVHQIECLRDTEEIVRWHHCCYDGTGYPEALEGENIPLLARMMKIIDVYCSMTSPRHYRKGYSTHEEALEYLKSESGKHFDPKLVKVFIEANVGQPLTNHEEKPA
ncbi:MAG TPA: HD domain-containing phosphohydrolase [Candidatus Hydrogenedentes bacterium]|nr:HD domain-containing phosphohydrolase [Candidatus Hydrogenedentota bacterium]HOL76186.1 HD domain-containing phosphohydrolase [Candidatus Hydrogenedentota bacterium]HPO86002.1 HD domain-containing phosphohydrolase [Candidatus Hydrogenedentota bacterium]